MNMAMKVKEEVEVIPTGLTANYIGYWTVRQALKEAAQNIAYGAFKSGEEAKFFYDDENELHCMEDNYIGFEKKHLYIGESEQRDDKDGLGNFGEGWKIFMLVMARQGLRHYIETVGFTAYGTMVPSPHGTNVLHINVIPNDKLQGTTVYADVSEEDMESVKDSFAILAGIGNEFVAKKCVIPGREKGELWINGVRIEQGDNTNPLDLFFAYNLKNRELMNRDRSQVNTEEAYKDIRELIHSQDMTFIKRYIDLAVDGNTAQDIIRGPYFPGNITSEAKDKWVEAIALIHGVSRPSKLILPSYNPDIDKEANYRGYTLLRFPNQWSTELSYIGFQKAAEVIRLKPQVEEVQLEERLERKILTQAKRDAKKALGLDSVKDLPKVIVVEKLQDGNGGNRCHGQWHPDTQTIYLAFECVQSQEQCSKTLLHEALHWSTGAGDNSPDFTRGWENACLRLMGYDIIKDFMYGNVVLMEDDNE